MRKLIPLFICALMLGTAVLMGCASGPQPKPGYPTETHNKYGGWIEACGELPPLLGDDC